MPEERPIIEEILDYGVYAPIGVMLSVVEDLPTFIEKGRRRVGNQLSLARVVGQFAIGTLRRRAEDVLGGAPPLGDAPSVGQATPAAGRGAPAGSAGSASPEADLTRRTGDALAIPGYDTLAASQVVARLEGLDAAELTAVREYEESTRRRRTILTRIAQLQAGGRHG